MTHLSGSLFLWACALLFCTCSIATGVPGKKTGPTSEDALNEYMEKWFRFAKTYRNDANVRKAVSAAKAYREAMERDIIADPRPPAIDIPSIPFRCDTSLGVSSTVPTSVHELRPGDITVVAALGDSMTAGNGISSEGGTGFDVLSEYRGESWCVGGDYSLELNVSTIPNILKKFNPDLKGNSLCSSSSDSEIAWFNAAVPGAKVSSLPNQADELITRMKDDSRTLYATDWKLITLMIGANDICSYCEHRDSRTPEQYKEHMRNTLDELHNELPRAFINVVPMVDLSPLPEVAFHNHGTHGNDSYPGEPGLEGLYPGICDFLHRTMCPCVKMNDSILQELWQIQQDYYQVTKELIDSRRYDTKDDFTVVLQPHLKDMVLWIDPITQKTDNRYFAGDCFHPNRRMHQVMAYMLWNVMLTKVGEKPLSADADMWPEYSCPSKEHPYFFTHVNSVDEPKTDDASQLSIAVATTISMAIVGFFGI